MSYINSGVTVVNKMKETLAQEIEITDSANFTGAIARP